MDKISRIYKIEIPILIRVFCKKYNQQRCKCTYYEELQISPNATQKEIRDAYIKLSKQMHPDNNNTGNHDDFVKLNEAYNILSNEQSKHIYDIDLKSNNICTNNFYQDTRSNNQYYNAYNIHYSAEKKENYEKKKKNTTIFCIFLIIIGIFFQIIRVISWSDHNKNAALQKSAEIQMEHEQNMKIFENKTFEEKVQILDKMIKNYNISVDDP
ncbi:dnaJ subfamily C member 4 [Apis mellifera caucasica]|uniref:DnaJ homolog subfamily C member 4 n=1 Tax=Apis mellifera TaxID=7460 RepID=A0A7M7MPT6_APIME|nr:dnaJ homolog subfamily C member 4 [Apis mellifera]KAG6796889.1 dnaJ subfamily C member 4 [Apis mellifera caucasica]KAG9430496.1 dnaJ subfamily C member 4 [Apis mellifera carnica]|eukprot:XP_026299155.1 dnaJ homolog subfamily C member 4 [Apis mellifera]